MRVRNPSYLLVLAALLFTQPVLAQTGPILPLDSPSLWNLNALLARGWMDEFNSGIYPVSELDYLEALSRISDTDPLSNQIAEEAKSHLFKSTDLQSGHWGIRVSPAFTGSTQKNLNHIRYDADPTPDWFTRLGYESWFTIGNWTAALGFRHDRYYDRDPESMDTAHRWATRPENAYVAYTGSVAQFSIGRVRQHWGGYQQPGLVLSDNPRPMDHVSLRIGSKKLSIQSSLSELDSITGDGRFTGVAGDDSVSSGSERRYLAAHRLTIQKESWTLGLMHSILYSGRNSGLSLRYANPFQIAFMSVDERPKNEENNGLLGAFFSRQSGRTLMQIQVALDDFDILAGEEPPSLAGTFHLYRAQIAPRLDLYSETTLVTARTYNSEQTEGKYVYLKRGMGTQYSDFISSALGLNWFHSSGLVFTPAVQFLLQGEQHMLKPFPKNEEADALLDGVIERTIRPSIGVRGTVGKGIQIHGQVGGNIVTNANHLEGEADFYMTGFLSIGYRFMWRGAF